MHCVTGVGDALIRPWRRKAFGSAVASHFFLAAHSPRSTDLSHFAITTHTSLSPATVLLLVYKPLILCVLVVTSFSNKVHISL